MCKICLAVEEGKSSAVKRNRRAAFSLGFESPKMQNTATPSGSRYFCLSFTGKTPRSHAPFCMGRAWEGMGFPSHGFERSGSFTRSVPKKPLHSEWLFCVRRNKRTLSDGRNNKRNLLTKRMIPFSHLMYSEKSMGEVSACSASLRHVLIASGSFPAFFSSSTRVYQSGFRQRYSINAASFSISEKR